MISALNTSSLALLDQVYCYSNALSVLDVSQNTALRVLSCFSNQLTSLNTSGCAILTELVCSVNLLTSLDISSNLKLERMNCRSNPGDGVSRFPVRAWFDNRAIPIDFTSGEWGYSPTIAINYYMSN